MALQSVFSLGGILFLFSQEIVIYAKHSLMRSKYEDKTKYFPQVKKKQKTTIIP